VIREVVFFVLEAISNAVKYFENAVNYFFEKNQIKCGEEESA